MSTKTHARTPHSIALRPLGKTGEEVSMVGLGGYHLGIPKDARESERIIHRAIDAGVTFMDNCWDYHDGESELRMGRALASEGRRDKVFLMTKIDGRTREAAARQIEESLVRLRTDRIDLVQLHEVIRMEDGDVVFRKGGAMEALREAKKAGKVRFLGFTGHKDPAVHLRMLDVAAEHDFAFDTVQMPLNVLDAHFRSFEHGVLPRLVKEGVGVLGMKPIAAGKIVESGAASARECLRYALSLPTSVVITGVETEPVLDQAIDGARTFEPMSDAEKKELLARTARYAKGGKYEEFKTSNEHDGTAKHVHWMG